MWLYAIGAALASYDRTHIKAEFVNVFARSARVRNLCRLVSSLVSAGMSVVFTKWSWDLCVYSVSVGEVTQAYPVPKVFFSPLFCGRHSHGHLFSVGSVDCLNDFRNNA